MELTQKIQEVGSKTEERILMFSKRNIVTRWFSTCSGYEFEDLIKDLDSVKILSPKPKKWFKKGIRIANNRYLIRTNIALNPGVPKIKVKRYYDLFFAYCQFPKELLFINTIEGWKDYCGTSICYLDEIWRSDIPYNRCFLNILKKFDYVLTNCSGSVQALKEVIGDKCNFILPAVDAIQLCPYPDNPKRFIDVYSLGRRSEVTHYALLRMAAEKKILYIYDTVNSLAEVIDHVQHRALVANLVKRSRYFIVNPGKRDEPETGGTQIEFGPRYFEGAAGGAILIGEIPQNDQFERIFTWPDAVIHLPFGSDKIGEIINELDKQPDRQEKIRKNNIVQSLLHHDWAYRWETILKIAGLEPLPALLNRKKRLKDLARLVEKETFNK